MTARSCAVSAPATLWRIGSVANTALAAENARLVNEHAAAMSRAEVLAEAAVRLLAACANIRAPASMRRIRVAQARPHGEQMKTLRER